MKHGFTNYHGHLHYCDGRGTADDYARAAIAADMPALGISCHATVPYSLPWTMQEHAQQDYAEEIDAAKKKFGGQLEIYRGLEVDFVPGVAGPSIAQLSAARPEYTIGSVHLVDFFRNGHPWEVDGPHMTFLDGLEQIFHRDIQAAVERYFALTWQMVQEDPPDIVGHLDKIKMQNEDGTLFNENALWYQDAVEATLRLIADQGLIVEINTRGVYKKKTTETYPSLLILRQMKALNIPVMINSDAHHPRELTECFDQAVRLLLDIGYQSCRVLYQGKWQDLALSSRGLVFET